MTTLIVIGVIALCVHLYRQNITNKALVAPPVVPFDGEIFCVGETVFAIREQGKDSAKVIVCFPGFTETMTYFTELYKDEDCRLILINNALYHSPFELENVTLLDWSANPFEPATIQYDGFYLAHILKEYATGSNVFVHGHSRGGAVVLDAGRQFPEITQQPGKTITALLEAAVVPKGTSTTPTPGKYGQLLMGYVMPIVFSRLANMSAERLEKMPMMNPTNELKTAIVLQNFRSPKHFWVFLINALNIPAWQQEQSHDLYQNYNKVVLIQGSRDDVLVNKTMEASALEGAKLNDQVEIVKTQNTNHFIALEQPHYIQTLVAS